MDFISAGGGTGTGTGADEVLALTANATALNNSTTWTDVDGLSFTVAANEKYIIDAIVLYESNAAADFLCAWSLPSGATCQRIGGTLYKDTALTETQITDAADWTTGAALVGGGGNGAGVQMSIQVRGLMEIDSTPGVAQLQFKQIAAHASDTIPRKGTIITVRKIT